MKSCLNEVSSFHLARKQLAGLPGSQPQKDFLIPFADLGKRNASNLRLRAARKWYNLKNK